MAGELIVNLRTDVRDAVLGDQTKYNPNFNSTIDEDEISELLSDFKAKDISELMSKPSETGLTVEKEVSEAAESRYKEAEDVLKTVKNKANRKECRRLSRELERKNYALTKDIEQLNLLISDRDNGTLEGYNGTKNFFKRFFNIVNEDKTGEAWALSSIGAFGAGLIVAELTLAEDFLEQLLIFMPGSIFIGLGALCIAGIGVGIYAGIKAAKGKKVDQAEYTVNLDKNIKELQSKIKNEQSEIAEIEYKIDKLSQS